MPVLEAALVHELAAFRSISQEDLTSWVSSAGLVSNVGGFQGQVAEIVLVLLAGPTHSHSSHVSERNRAMIMLSSASQLLVILGDWCNAVGTQSASAPLISTLARWACDKGVLYDVSEVGELLPCLSDRSPSKMAKPGDANWDEIRLLHQPSFSATTVYQPPSPYHSHGSKPVDVPHSEVPAVVSRGNEDGQLVSNDAGYTLTPEDQSNLSMLKAVLRYRVGHRAPVVKLRKTFSSDHPLGTTESLLAYLSKLDDNRQLKGFSLKYIDEWWFLSLVSADAALTEPSKESVATMFKAIIHNRNTYVASFDALESLFPKPFRLFSPDLRLHKYAEQLPELVVRKVGGRRMLSLAPEVAVADTKPTLPAPQHVEKSRDRHVQLPSSVPTSTTLNPRVPPPFEHSTRSLKSIPVVVPSATATSVGNRSIPNDGVTPRLTEDLVVSTITTILSYRRSGAITLHEVASGLASRQPLYRRESLLNIFRDRPGFSLKQIGEDMYLSLDPSGADSTDTKVSSAYHPRHTQSEELIEVAAMLTSILKQCSGAEICIDHLGSLFSSRERLFGKNLSLTEYLQQLSGFALKRNGDKWFISLGPAENGATSLPKSPNVSEERPPRLTTWHRSQSPLTALAHTQPAITSPAPGSMLVLTGDASYVLTPQDETAVHFFKMILGHRLSGSITLEELGSGLARTRFFGGASYLLDYIRKLPGFALCKEGDDWCLFLAPSDETSHSNDLSIDAASTLSKEAEAESATALFKLYLKQCINQTSGLDVVDSMFPQHNRRFGKESSLYEYFQKLPEFQLSTQRGKQILSLTLPEVGTAEELHSAVDLLSTVASSPSVHGNIIADNDSLASVLTDISHDQSQNNQPIEQVLPTSSTAVSDYLTGDPNYTLTAEDVDTMRLIDSFLRKRRSGSVSVELLEHMFPDDDRVFAQGLNLVDYFRLLPGFVFCQVGETMSLTLAPPATETVHPTTKPATTHVVALCREHTRDLAKYYHSISAIIPYRLPVYGIARRTLYTASKYIAVQSMPLIARYTSTGASSSLPLTGILARNDVGCKASLSTLVRPPAVPSLVPVRGLLKVLRRGLRW